MPRFGIAWRTHDGNRDADIVEADDKQAADKKAYEAYRQDYEDNADYGSVEIPDSVVSVDGCPFSPHNIEATDEDGETVDLEG